MPAFRISHQHIVRLIKNIGAVTVRTVLFQIDILIHIRVHGIYVIFFIFFIKGIQNLL